MILARLALVMGLSCTALTAFDAKADVMEIDADGARWVAGGGAAQAAAPVETLAFPCARSLQAAAAPALVGKPSPTPCRRTVGSYLMVPQGVRWANIVWRQCG